MANNIFQRNIVPEKPRILRDERVYVYVPKATNGSPGIASFKGEDFGVNDGKVSLIWPMQMDVERLADPTQNVSRIKVLDDEFENTGEEASVTNPVTGTTYKSTTAEVKLKRKDRKAFTRPDLVQIDEGDFDATRDSQTGYVKYTLKKNDPFKKPSLVQLDTQDFKRPAGIVQINWPIANTDKGSSNTNGFGLVRIAEDSKGCLNYDANGNLQVDLDAVMASGVASIKPTYGGTKDNGFVNIDDYRDPITGLAKRGPGNNPLIAITKEAVGLSKVANKAFADYTYEEFGAIMKKHFEDRFNLKLDKQTWNTLFADWNPPSPDKDTPQRWFEALEGADESLREQLRTIRLFLGYFEDLNALTALYPASELVYGSTAYLLSYRTYYAVRTQNVDKMFATDAEAKSYDPPKDSKGKYLYAIYVTGSKATGNRFMWTSESKAYRPYGDPNDAIWLDYFLNEDEDLAGFIEENRNTLVSGDRIGIRETGQVYVWNGTEAELSADTVYYEWYDTNVSNLSFMDFVEKSASAFQPDGVASPGNSGLWAQSNHVHPSDPKKLDLSTFQRTNVTVTSEFNSEEEDFVFNFYEVDATGNYVPNRTVNIPYVRKGQTIHNYQGNPTTFVDSVESSEHYWAGTAAEFTAEKDNIPNNSLIVVDDNEDFIVTEFLSESDLLLQGITIDPYNPTDKFVITNNTDAAALIGVPLTIKHSLVNGNDRYNLAAITGIEGEGRVVVSTAKNGQITVKTVALEEGKLVVGDEDGAMTQVNILATDLVTKASPFVANELVIAGSDNTVKTWNTGTQSERLLVSDGLGGVTLKTFNSPKSLLVSSAEENLEEAGISVDNVLITANSMDTVVLPQGEIVVAGQGNVMATYDTGTVGNRMLVSDGNGGLKVSTLTANKMLYTSADGVPAAFPMSTADAGKFFGVNAQGMPALLAAPAQPTTLPVTKYTTNPGANANGLVVAVLNADPGTYSEGVLYLW